MIKIGVLILGMVAMCFASNTLSLNEAEKMVENGEAVLVRVDDQPLLNSVVADKNETAVLDVKKEELVVTLPPVVKAEPQLPITVEPTPPAIQLAKPIAVAKEGVDITMPTTLSSLLIRLSKLTGEVYFCDDDINIPASTVKITGIAHLEKYLAQVSSYRIEVLKDSGDITIPIVLKVHRAEKKND